MDDCVANSARTHKFHQKFMNFKAQQIARENENSSAEKYGSGYDHGNYRQKKGIE